MPRLMFDLVVKQFISKVAAFVKKPRCSQTTRPKTLPRNRPMFFFAKCDPAPTACEKILSILYRISEVEFREHLLTCHGVNIVALSHRFLQEPNKIGGEGDLLLFGPPRTPHTTNWRKVTQEGNVEILKSHGSARFLFTSRTQTLSAQFEGDSSQINLFTRHLSLHIEKYTAVYLYIANRFRADAALRGEFAADRQFFDDLSCCLRQSANLNSGLELIRERIGATGIHLFLRSPFDLPDTLLATANPTHTQGGGTGEQVTIPVGQHHGIGTRSRGKLVVFGSEELLDSEECRKFLNRISRELAARIDELDESFETTLITQSTQLAELFCSKNLSTNDAVIEPFLKILGDTMAGILRRHLPPNPKEPLQSKVKLDAVRGPALSAFFRHFPRRSSLPLSNDIEILLQRSNTSMVVVVYDCQRASAALTFSGDLALLGAIRRHVFEWIHNLVSLVQHFLQLEWKRKSWMQRTMHEIKHPLQGIVAIAELLEVMIPKRTVRRSELQHYLNDLVGSIESTRVLLQRFDAVNGIENVEVSPKLVLIEADVLRPVRRMLQGTAQTKNVILNDTVGYEVVPQLKIDPNLLRLVFFNLLDNAVKYSTPGTSIDVHCSFSESAFHVDISDCGISILEKDEDSLFLEEFRGENTKTISGLGLGLHTSRALATKLGCRVSLVDHGRNTGRVTFRLSIPESLRSLEEL